MFTESWWPTTREWINYFPLMMESCSAIKKQKEEHNTDGFQKPWAVWKKPGVKEHTLYDSILYCLFYNSNIL